MDKKDKKKSPYTKPDGSIEMIDEYLTDKKPFREKPPKKGKKVIKIEKDTEKKREKE